MPITSGAVASALTYKFLGISAMSQVLYKSSSAYSANANIAVLGAYGHRLINFQSITVPEGFHKEFVLSATIQTDDSIMIRARINNIATEWGNTWSISSFRVIVCSNRFRLESITLEPTLNYQHQDGINLYIETNGGNGNGFIDDITISCFVVPD